MFGAWSLIGVKVAVTRAGGTNGKAMINLIHRFVPWGLSVL
jgi:hypothetical protein